MGQLIFHEISTVEEDLFRYAVIVSHYQGKWVYCKQKARTTWEIPGGTREPGEPILTTAQRELFEETGALEYDLFPICAYRINSYGLLCYAEIKTLGDLPNLEMEKIQLFECEPENLTHPTIHPFLFEKAKDWLGEER